MFRITEDPSSGSLVQCLAKIIRMVVSCPLTWRAYLDSELHTHTHTHTHTHINIGLQYAAITPTTSMSTDTTETFW